MENIGENVVQRHLPEHLIINEILPCLPVKALYRFKSISKKWYSCISSPNFLLKFTKQPLFPHLCSILECMIIQIRDRYYLYKCDPNDDNVEQLAMYNREECLVELHVNFNVTEIIYLVGSCNGLVCLGELYGEFFILWNPATGQFHKYYIPDYQDLDINEDFPYDISWGFGYVSSQDDYKVVCRISVLGIVNVFSMRTNSWRQIECGLRDVLSVGNGCFVDEKLYWNVTFIPGGSKFVVFDLAKETLELIPNDLSMHHVLTVMGGYLAFGMCIKDGKIGIVRNQRNVVYVCSCELNRKDFGRIIGFTKTGNMFEVNYRNPSLVLIDATSKRILVTFEGFVEHTGIDSYAPSQISPPPPVGVLDAIDQVPL